MEVRLLRASVHVCVVSGGGRRAPRSRQRRTASTRCAAADDVDDGGQKEERDGDKLMAQLRSQMDQASSSSSDPALMQLRSQMDQDLWRRAVDRVPLDTSMEAELHKLRARRRQRRTVGLIVAVASFLAARRWASQLSFDQEDA